MKTARHRSKPNSKHRGTQGPLISSPRSWGAASEPARARYGEALRGDRGNVLATEETADSGIGGTERPEHLVERVRERLYGTLGVVELRMFGGWGVTVHGNMAVGVMERDLIVRVGPANFYKALTRPGVRPFDFTGRAMTGETEITTEPPREARTAIPLTSGRRLEDRS